MNELYYGDNLEVLRKYIKDETIDLCYIDPPFNSKRNYNQIYNNIGSEDKAQAQAFIDTWAWNSLAEEGFTQIMDNYQGKFTAQTIALIGGLKEVLGKDSLLAYLISITLRAVEIHRVLKPTGSFYLHCDSASSHYLKLVLDAVFCSQGGDFHNEIIWKRTTAHNDPQRYGRIHDCIFFYSKTENKLFNRLRGEYSQEQLSRYKYHDAKGYFRAENLTAPHFSPTRTIEWRGVHPGANRQWRFSLEKLEQLYTEGCILLRRDGKPRKDGLKQYLHETEGSVLQDIWTDIVFSPTAKERLGYPTQKPKALLERIIESSSNENDVILDAYCGCGTTVEVSQKLNRQWIGIDITYQSISLILKRLEDSFGSTVLNQIMVNGIPKDIKSAEALANRKDDRTRKEFEKWAVLTYSKNRAVINQKKGADKGIDGFAFFLEDERHKKIVFQVKSGNVKSGDIRDLYGTVTREKAAMGIFITFKPPSAEMIKEANVCGLYHHKVMGRSYPCIQIVTIKEILEQSKRLDIPLNLEVLKTAEKQTVGKQLTIPFSDLDNDLEAV